MNEINKERMILKISKLLIADTLFVVNTNIPYCMDNK